MPSGPLTLLGICKLCLQSKELQDGHLMPAGVYRRTCTPGTPNPNPVVVSKYSSVSTSDQIRAHILCRDCEQLFNRNGENYVMRLIARRDRFPALEMIQNVRGISIKEFKGVRKRDAPELDRDKLAYFALSVFWRASIHVWRSRNGSLTTIDLGAKYNEELRRYLLGETVAPENVVLLAIVCSDVISQDSFFTPNFSGKDPVRSYSFSARGLLFVSFFGRECPISLRRLSCIDSQEQWIFSRDCKDKTLDAFFNLIKQQSN